MKIARLPIIFLCMLIVALALAACTRARSDADITTDVQTALHADAALTAAPITVQASNGVVVLSGAVTSEAERSTAESLVRQVAGVTGVVNNLQVAAAAA